MNKVHLMTFILFSLLGAHSACNNQGNARVSTSSLLKQSSSSQKAILDSKATVIHKDKKGNLWLASEDSGLYRFANKKLQLFTSKDGLKSYRIIGVQEDSHGNIYLDTPKGIFKYKNDKFISLSIAESRDSEYDWNSKLGDLWFRIGWERRGPYRSDGTKLYPFAFSKSPLEDEFYKKHPNASFNPYSIYSMYKDQKGNMWFGTSNMGVYIFDGEKLGWMHENHMSETPEGGNFGIRSIGEDKDGNYWICNTNYKYSLLPNDSLGAKLNMIKYERLEGVDSPSNPKLNYYSIENDAQGNLLMFAKEDGLWKNDGKKLTQFFIKDGERNISPNSMYKDYLGIFWFGSEHGIYKYDGMNFEKFRIE